MYLKCLEMTGFKSFAERTRLDFEPGMTAIVGPNGCGKSNVSDAIRWVIGETSAKALRGTKMEDCIFNGTDARKPLGMAEAAITFADCEKVLGTDFNEVTIGRRVLRTGEGEYFINKTPCRLKDIQRLFMDTGIGTTSYSVLEQGRIDQILSSRPEDRRTIFEEASGITKFKADRKEAIRKLEHTEANLLRLADVIREVKRQIGSLQRQAGKARRYREFKDGLRALDLFASRRNLAEADRDIRDVESRIAKLNAELTAAQDVVEALEKENADSRARVVALEREIGTAMEASVQAQSTLDHTREMIELNSGRIVEYQSFSQRDAEDIEHTGHQIAKHEAELRELDTRLDTARTGQEDAAARMQADAAAFEAHQHDVEQVRARIRESRDESVELESLASRLQNQLVEIESRERSADLRKERLAAEKAQLARVVESYAARQAAVTQELDARAGDVEAAEAALEEWTPRLAALRAELDDAERTLAELRTRDAGLAGRLDLLGSEPDTDAFPSGARFLLDAANPDGIDRHAVLGSLADALEVDAPYRTALEAALRAWLDAVLVADFDSVRSLTRMLHERGAGAGRLLAVRHDAEPPPPADGPGARLADQVRCDASLRGVVERLLGSVYVVPSLDALPHPFPNGLVCVTHDGCLVRGDGSAEVWTAAAPGANPLSRKHMLEAGRSARAEIEGALAAAEQARARILSDVRSAETARDTARDALDAARQTLAQKVGENDVVSRETVEARQRLETVSWEYDSLNAQQASDGSTRDDAAARIRELADKRHAILEAIRSTTDTLHTLEGRQAEIQAAMTDARIACARATQQVEHIESQRKATASRLDELRNAHASRVAGIASYENSIRQLGTEIEAARGRLAEMEDAVRAASTRAATLRRNRAGHAEALIAREAELAEKRKALDTLRNAKSEREIHYTECRMRRQNLLDRVVSEYGVTEEQVLAAPEPLWDEAGRPAPEVLDTRIAELRTKLDAMGPVNLVAIDEHRELEERYAFLTGQETDLLNAKEQLHAMIRKINRTTSEMFRDTFHAVNGNFEGMFRRLFNGGSAKLVLVNEEDVLECGIEIIARPPGKRLQNISLLSGGERTLTAVALLLAIYMIKPSPFCLLDELDAALDDSNIGRFVAVLKEFLAQSQFVVITHNRQTIAAADTLYGVTMPEKGVSRLVSMRFNPDTKPAPTA
jgi:chromosome segregation protein